MEFNPVREFEYVPMRKQSSGDLQSRLKTRKLLGVGESEDGSVPLSKIHQILGSDDHCMLTIPPGLRIWLLLSAGMFSIVSLMTLLFPGYMFDVSLDCEKSYAYALPGRLYGAALLGLSIVLWSAVNTVSKHVMRWCLLAQSVYFSIQILVTAYTLWETDGYTFWTKLVLLSRVLFLATSLFFYVVLSGVKGLRRVRSASDLDKSS
ncbi:tumor protein p53-inducible protein 11-like isoform X2 [Ptychodera flava]|uniref:tumor protein p53-inducible protein 11-like isoform X2 n=1 Tax=Ptychodera flava TaxID=63121 RepID=UPI00396A462C